MLMRGLSCAADLNVVRVDGNAEGPSFAGGALAVYQGVKAISPKTIIFLHFPGNESLFRAFCEYSLAGRVSLSAAGPKVERVDGNVEGLSLPSAVLAAYHGVKAIPPHTIILLVFPHNESQFLAFCDYVLASRVRFSGILRFLGICSSLGMGSLLGGAAGRCVCRRLGHDTYSAHDRCKKYA